MIRGLQWLRNRTTHALPLTLRAVGGLSTPITVPITLPSHSIIWHHADQLPPEDPNYTSPAGRSAYNTAFAHKPLLDPLDDVAQWFAAERSRPGSALTGM
ncbi:hypothetical protein ACPC54_41375 [Kitasatospora sp. NPDC094028]